MANLIEDKFRKLSYGLKIDCPFSAPKINLMYQDGKNQFWLGTLNDGLIKFDRNTGKTSEITTAHGLPSNAIWGMLEDDVDIL
jgi:ligand-binding sensor domain-containing protein